MIITFLVVIATVGWALVIALVFHVKIVHKLLHDSFDGWETSLELNKRLKKTNDQLIEKLKSYAK